MKRTIIGLSILGLVLLLGYFLTITLGLGGDLGLLFGYYGKYNIARHEIEKTGCLEKIDHSLVHEKLTLDNFEFTLHTKSKWKLDLRFFSGMDIRQVCERPKGLLVYHPVKQYQVYSMEYLSEALQEQGIKLTNLQDVLCNLDVLMPIFRENYENNEIPCTDVSLDGYTEYLVITNIPWKRETTTPEAVKQPVSTAINDRSKSSPNKVTLRSFEFDVVTLDLNGIVKAKTKMQAPYYSEDFGSGITLEMVQIPSGQFQMGTPSSEAATVSEEYKRCMEGHDLGYVWREHPQHLVTMPSFYMGKFEVTQAQWRAVSQLPKVNKDLASDPAAFKGDDLPIDSLSWEDGVEFCERLSRKTGRSYRLPTEAEWEYACRAGAMTQFHFGDTITSKLANYNGYYSYGSGQWWVARKETTPVGIFGVANAFGLYDMHGNVEEWCMDAWHDNYIGAPSDGSAWLADGDDLFRVTRGGNWLQTALEARAANRRYQAKIGNSYYIGFRVVCIAAKP